MIVYGQLARLHARGDDFAVPATADEIDGLAAVLGVPVPGTLCATSGCPSTIANGFLVERRGPGPLAAYDFGMQKVIGMSLGAAGPPHEVVLTLQGDDWELHVWATFDDLARLRSVRSAVWDERRSIAAGTSAGSQVFWAGPAEGADSETATVLIGHDDETWDIAILVPVTVVEKIGDLAGARQVD